MSLKKYREKRDFRKTHEPQGEPADDKTGRKPVFVIQEHDASSHHFDLRLEIDGVLKSWAGPKGPSTDPGPHFIESEVVGEVGFTEWTREGRLRHPRFLGLRRDKKPRDVVREDKR